MKLPFALTPYPQLKATWPSSGRHILASYDETSIIVYQAYRAEIAQWAVAHQRFGGPWSFERMSWIKPNFFWMMYRAGWASKPGQEHILAVKLKREGFEQLLAQAEYSSYQPEVYTDHETWRAALNGDVRLQWDPDHGPRGEKLERRAVQLGLRGQATRSYATDWILSITDISAYVREQHAHVEAGREDALMVPHERVYVPQRRESAARLMLDAR